MSFDDDWLSNGLPTFHGGAYLTLSSTTDSTARPVEEAAVVRRCMCLDWRVRRGGDYIPSIQGQALCQLGLGMAVRAYGSTPYASELSLANVFLLRRTLEVVVVTDGIQ